MTRLLPQPTTTERTHRKGEEKLFVLRTRLQASTIQFSAQLEWNYCELPIPPLGIVPTGFRGLCHSGRPPSEGVREALYSPPPPPSSTLLGKSPSIPPPHSLPLPRTKEREEKKEISHREMERGRGGRELSLPPILFLRPSHGPFSIPPSLPRGCRAWASATIAVVRV